MKKVILAILFLIGCAYAMNVYLVRKYKKENEQLLSFTAKQERLIIKQERLNIKLTREAFENYPYKAYSIDINKYSKVFDSLVLMVDSMVHSYPKLHSYQRNKFNHFYNTITSKKLNLDTLLKVSSSKLTFELELLTWLNSIGKDLFVRPTCVERNSIYFIPEDYNIPLGSPLKFYIGLFGEGLLNIDKNLKINIPFKTDSFNKQIGYLPTDKMGTFKVQGYYNYNYMGEELKFSFFSFEYTVTEPDIRTTIVHKNYLNLNQDNRISFDFGRYKSKDIDIKIEGASYTILNNNTFNIHPTNKKVKIQYWRKDTYQNKPINLGYKEYEAR